MLLVVENTLHGLITALHRARLDVVLAAALAWSDVLHQTASTTPCLCSWEVCVAHHLPDGLDALII